MRKRLALFPLAVVLLPGATMPLHIFEPRYRQLVAHCMESDQRFGLIYHDPDRAGPFDMEPGRIGCIAEIEEFQPLQDGRSLVMTRGVERFRLTDGIESDALYYEGLVEEYEDVPEDAAEVERRQRETEARFRHVIQALTGESIPAADAPVPVSFQLARWVKIDPQWQQQLLESRSELQRLEQIDTLLSDAEEEI